MRHEAALRRTLSKADAFVLPSQRRSMISNALGFARKDQRDFVWRRSSAVLKCARDRGIVRDDWPSKVNFSCP